MQQKVPSSMTKKRRKNTATADVAIVVVGETPYAEFFGDIGDGFRHPTN